MTDNAQARGVELGRQLRSAIEVGACFCISCEQPDEPDLHDPMRCPGMGGTRDQMTIAEAVRVFDDSCEGEPDLDDEARALHCAIVAARLAHVSEPLRAEGEEKARRVADAWRAVMGSHGGAFGNIKDGYDPTIVEMRAAVAALASTTPAESGEGHGLGPHAAVLDDEPDGFRPVAVLVGQCVYIQQGGQQITLSPAVAGRLAAALSQQSETTAQGDEPRGCPTPGACSCPDATALPASTEVRYLIWSNEHRAWWKPERCGYTRVIERAGRYERKEALSIAQTRGGGWPLEDNPYEIAIPETDAIAQSTRAALAAPADQGGAK